MSPQPDRSLSFDCEAGKAGNARQLHLPDKSLTGHLRMMARNALGITDLPIDRISEA